MPSTLAIDRCAADFPACMIGVGDYIDGSQRRMLLRSLILSVVISLALLGCSDRETPTSSIPFKDTIVSVPFHQSVAVPGTNFSVRFDQIPYDGRLPSGTVDSNWWTNTARIAVTIEPLNANVQLYISGEVPNSNGVHFDGAPAVCQGYSFRLVELIPLPAVLLVTPPDSELIARIEIRDTTIAPPTDSCPFPLNLGNQWIYLDSTFSDDILQSVTTDTVTIDDEYTDQNGHWWLFSPWLDPFGHITSGKADTLYSQQPAYAPLPPGTPMYFPSKELIPPVGDSSRYMIIVEGDMMGYRSVITLSSTVTTPAGDFDQGFRYIAEMGYETNAQILVPGVGFIYLESRRTIPSGPQITRRLWLSAYHLK